MSLFHRKRPTPATLESLRFIEAELSLLESVAHSLLVQVGDLRAILLDLRRRLTVTNPSGQTTTIPGQYGPATTTGVKVPLMLNLTIGGKGEPRINMGREEDEAEIEPPGISP